MTKRLLPLVVLICTLSLVGCDNKKPGIIYPTTVEYPSVAISKTRSTKLYVHYMPWFENKETSGTGKWGMHWTMATKDPDKISSTGKREIASNFYPLIGPYASSDKDVIEYHLLLMKYAGIDGVLIDWYGTFDLNDYKANLRNSDALIKQVGKVGLQFGIVYEDRTVDNVVAANLQSSKSAVLATDLRYMATNYFTNSSYITVGGSPLLLVWGPTSIKTESEWLTAFNSLNKKPCLLTLQNQVADAGSAASGEFTWPNESNAKLDDFYKTRMPSLKVTMGTAYPGFDDYYSEGGWGNSIPWTIPYNSGATLTETLNMSSNANVSMLQLVTWNDFGEGTMIEPTQEFGFLFLQKIAQFSGVQVDTTTFDMIYKLYQLRKKYASNSSVQQQLDQVFYDLVSLKVDSAKKILDEIK